VQQVLKKLTDGTTKSRLPYRTEFARTTIRCIVNEGLSAGETAALHFRNFDLSGRWVEFLPQNADSIVRRRLSDDTAKHIVEIMQERGAQPDDLVCRYFPKRWPQKHAKRRPQRRNCANAISYEIGHVGFDKKQFSVKRLKWIWTDENPNLRDDEELTAILARFVLVWAYPYQQEALFQRIYKNSPVLRPSWAYPKWHKKATESAGHPTRL